VNLSYRLQQLRNNLTASPLTDQARVEIAACLTPAERVLFERLGLADQQHSYLVLSTLRAAGYNHPDLMTAALLHDIGKVSCPLSAWDRTLIVVGSGLFPARAEAWGHGSLQSWRRPFVARAQHPAWGAALAAEAGVRPAVVEMIRRHQDAIVNEETEIDRLLVALQWADDRN